MRVVHFDSMKNVVGKTFFCNQLTDAIRDVVQAFAQSDSAIWFCKRNSIIALNPETEKYSVYALSDEKTPFEFSILASKNNKLWLGSSYGICLFDMNDRRILYRYVNDPASPESI